MNNERVATLITPRDGTPINMPEALEAIRKISVALMDYGEVKLGTGTVESAALLTILRECSP